MFNLKDGTGAVIAGAKVVVRTKSANIVALSGLTDASGNIDLSGLSDGPYSLLAYKAGAFNGARIDGAILGGSFLPMGLALVKVAQLNMAFQVFKGDYSTPLKEVSVVIKDNTGASVWGAITNPAGQAAALVNAQSFVGWTATFTVVGFDGAIVPLDGFTFANPYLLVLAPTIGSDE